MTLFFWSDSYSNLFCLFNASMYVLSLYMIPSKIRALPRDNISNIKYRLTAASVATTLSIFCYICFLPNENTTISKWASIGLRCDTSVSAASVAFVLMCVFYLGPIIALVMYLLILLKYDVRLNGIIEPLDEDKQESVMSVLSYWCSSYLKQYHEMVIFRNIVFAPVTEEIVFRAVMIPSMCLAATTAASSSSSSLISPISIALHSPLWFGVAHLHHFIDKMRTKVPLMSNVLQTVVQLIYTSIFGVIASLLFMRTGNILAPIVSHVLCNLLGLPDVGFMYSTTSNERNEYSCLYSHRYLLLGLHAFGLVAFGFLLFPLTEHLAAQSIYWNGLTNTGV